MIFKELELAGFKSFADRIEIKFDSGITAIVGPNGCGKSNVADAIRWVLGEQRSKELRGSSMQDVIFNGTEKRKSLSYCEVTLTFNNETRFFNYDFDEIAITRKLYRSGESEYLINRNQCRLKDIQELLYGSGAGRDGYSIIGQGQVEKIISAKPEDRRAIFEDAAGISKFKSRKQETENKLARTRDNLSRLNDIIYELERQMGPLKKQAENAKIWLELRDKLKDLEINAYIFQFENAKNVKDAINVRLDAIKEDLDLQTAKLNDATEDYNKAMEELSTIDAKIADAHNLILKLTVEMEQQSGEIKVIRERINNMTEKKDNISRDILNSKNQIEKSNAELSFKQDQYKGMEEKLGALRLSYDELSSEYLEIADEVNKQEDEAQINQKAMIDAMDKLSDLKSNISKYQAEKQLLEENLKVTDEREKTILSTINQKRDDVKSLEDICLKLYNEKSTTEKKYADAVFKSDSLAREIKELEENKHNLNSKIQVYENKKRLLEDMQNSYEGYAYAVKKLLKDAKQNQMLASKMMGVLAELITVPQKYESAIEVALGSAVQNIVTFNEINAKDLITYLKSNSYGRATFLPINKMKPKYVDRSDMPAFKTAGCFGIASELISYSSDIDNVISNLLGSTIIVDNMDTALKISGSTHYSYKIVTLDGDVVNPTGSMTGGSRKSEASNLISREREIQTLYADVEKFKAELIVISSNISQKSQKLSSIKSNLEKYQKEKNDADINFAKENERYTNLKSQLDDQENELNGITLSKNHISQRIQYITNELDSIDSIENNANSTREIANQFVQERQEKFNKLYARRNELNEKITTIKVEIASIEATIKNFDDDIMRINDRIREENTNISKFENDYNNLDKTIQDAEQIIKSQLEQSASVEAKKNLDDVKQKQLLLEQEKYLNQNKIKQLDTLKQELNDLISKANDKRYSEELKLNKVDTELENMQTRISEEYSLDYESCLPFRKEDFDFQTSVGEIYNLKREISKLGSVNVSAIEDVKTLLERYTDLKTQADDLTKAESELNIIIKDLSDEMITRFNTQFAKIQENFKVTFRELFGGGNARLELTESDDPLLAGVDIVAEPPGKKLQNITLLSGGEKALTAIAILFSILKLKPMPFCLLDEIEAALDDANVERFAQYLHRFSETTQFIVITHRKPTMELADRLYGVTMEEKGVSRTVSVSLSDAIKNAEQDKKQHA